MTYKTIFKGRLEFGSPKSYDKVLRMYQHRVENFYKSDILLKEEDIFDEESSSLNVPRFITQGSIKSFKNTKSLLEYVAQFAVSGDLEIWMTEDGKILNHGIVEPIGDRTAVQAFLKGRKLIAEKGKEKEAKVALSNAIEKYERHAQAYERRGHVNFLLKNYKDALYDFRKSVDISPNKPEGYLGAARILILENDLEGAVLDLEQAIKKSIPLQPIYWLARRLKADCLLKLKDYKGAELDLKLFCKRKFKSDNPNFYWRRYMFFQYGKTLIELENYTTAIEAFNECLAIEEGKDKIPEFEKLHYRGIALQKAGKKGFKADWKKAVKLGSKKTAELLATT